MIHIATSFTISIYLSINIKKGNLKDDYWEIISLFKKYPINQI